MDRLYYWARSVQQKTSLRLPRRLREFLRSAGYEVLRLTGLTVGVRLPGGAVMRIPAYFYRNTWNTYEARSMEQFVTWCRARSDRPDAILDIGCAFGVYTGAALFANPNVEVIGFDSDLTSLRLVADFARHAARADRRVRLVLGYLDAESADRSGLDEAVAATTRRMAEARDIARYEHTSFRCLADPIVANTPIYTVDALFNGGRALQGRRVLLKCDVEGAEVRVLRGAEAVLRAVRPQLLLSVHGTEDLARHGSTAEELQQLLRRNRYQRTVLERDHESHWWCTPEA